LLLVAMAACTSTARTTTASTVTAPTTRAVDYGAQYLTITGPPTDALTRLEGTSAPTAPDFQSAESASETLPYQLLDASWPTNAKHDIEALASAWGAVVADCRLMVFNPAGDTTALVSDEGKLAAAVRVVKSDLRLPT
jgi:hypothetical protein